MRLDLSEKEVRLIEELRQMREQLKHLDFTPKVTARFALQRGLQQEKEDLQFLVKLHGGWTE